jgi:hypothetical protein
MGRESSGKPEISESGRIPFIIAFVNVRDHESVDNFSSVKPKWCAVAGEVSFFV